MADPIVVDIGAAIQTLEANPGLAAKLNELAFGKVAADQLAAREALIMQLGAVVEAVAKEGRLPSGVTRSKRITIPSGIFSQAQVASQAFRAFAGEEHTT